MPLTIQELDKDIKNYIISTMKNEFHSVTLSQEDNQHYHRSCSTCENTEKKWILEIRTELFLDSNIDQSSIAITVFIESESVHTRADFSVKTFREAVAILSGFICMSVFFQR